MTEATPNQPVHPEKKKGKGCRTALIIVGVLLLIVIVGGYFACPYLAKYTIEKGIDALEAKIIDQLPDDYDESEVKDVFRQVRETFKNGKISGERMGMKMQELSMTIQEALKDENLTKKEVDEILTQLRELTNMVDKE